MRLQPRDAEYSIVDRLKASSVPATDARWCVRTILWSYVECMTSGPPASSSRPKPGAYVQAPWSDGEALPGRGMSCLRLHPQLFCSLGPSGRAWCRTGVELPRQGE